jgi:glutamate-1-semialdehyde 2,1-aminomutase
MVVKRAVLPQLWPRMDEFQKHDVIGHNQTLGQKFIDGSKEIFRSHGLSDSIKNLQFNWHASLGYFDQTGNNSFGLRTLFHQEMISRGVLFQGIFCPHYSHTEEDLNHILSAMNDSCVIYKKGLEEGFEKFLVGDPIKPVFRKFI